MPKRKGTAPLPVPLNKVKGKGMLKYDLTNIPPKLRRTESLNQERSSSTTTKGRVVEKDCNMTDLLNAHQNTEEIHKPDEPISMASSSVPVDDPFQWYCLGINRSNYFCPCNEDFTAFAMADFDKIKNEVMERKVQIVRRKAVSFIGDVRWLYSCSCNLTYAEYIEALSEKLNFPFKDFQETLCIHCKLTNHIVKDLDTLWDVTPEVLDTDHCYGIHPKTDKKTLQFTELDFGNTYVVVTCAGFFPGVVSISSSKLFCLTCQHLYCNHCTYVKSFMDKSNDEEVPDIILHLLDLMAQGSKQQETYIYKCLSMESVDFRLPENLRQQYLRLNFIKENDTYHMFPDEFAKPVCDRCDSEWEDTCFSQQKDVIPLFCKNEIHKATVFGKKCQQCDNQLIFDGGSSCILNMNSFLIHQEVLRDYMWHFLNATCTLYAYYNIWNERMKDMGIQNFQSLLSYSKFRHSWYAYLNLLNINYEQGFSCPVCKECPDTVICDATSLSFRKTFMKWTTELNPSSEIRNGRFKDRVLIDNKRTRTLVQKYASGKSLGDGEFQIILGNIKAHFPSGNSLFEMLNNIGCTNLCPKEYQSLLQMLSSPSPACALLPYSTENDQAIKRLLEINADIGCHPDLLLYIQENLPLLYEIVKDIGPLNNNVIKIISAVAKKSKAIVDSSDLHSIEPIPQKNDVSAFFPLFKTIRDRGLYKADKFKKEADFCKKDSTRHPTLLPGIFTVFCKHGICYGFQLMESNESPNVPFTFLRTRFERGMELQRLVYDNACNLHAYCLNRDPVFFGLTLFVVDNMHWGNHTSCSKVYHAKVHPRLQGVNTQMVEQNYSKLRKLKSQLSYMNHCNFMNHLKFFLWYCNINVLVKL